MYSIQKKILDPLFIMRSFHTCIEILMNATLQQVITVHVYCSWAQVFAEGNVFSEIQPNTVLMMFIHCKQN